MSAELDHAVLTGEDLDRVRARLEARANIGLSPTDPSWLDAVVGSILGDLVGPVAIELDLAYDLMEIVARAVIPALSFGQWLDDWAESVGLERRPPAQAGGLLTFVGAPGTIIAFGQQVTTTAGADSEPIAFQVDVGGVIGGGGSIDLAATAVTPGGAGTVPAGTVTIPTPSIDGLASVTNAAAMGGGADVESDELLSARVVEALSSKLGAGNVAAYKVWLGSLPGVGSVTVVPVARGAGTVDVYIRDLSNGPMPPAAVAVAQAIIDPVTGQGLGVAPVGHDVLILTPTGFALAVVATIAHEAGYSLDGAAGTQATRAALVASLGRYASSIPVAGEVVRNHVIAALVDVAGVHNISGLTINGSATDTLAIPAGETAVLGVPTLS